MAVNPSGDDNRAGNPYVDMDGDVHANGTTIYMEDATVVVGSTTGTKFGTATTDLIGFYNATPVDQPGAYTQTYSTGNKTVAAPTTAAVTDNTTGAVGTTLAAGAGVYSVAINLLLAGITDADIVTSFLPGHKFKILAFDFYTTVAATTADKLSTINLEIGSNNVTGGEIALTSANCTPKGAKVAGAAITAANTGSASDVISIEASSTTAFAEGAGVFVIRLQNMDTADAFASLSDQATKGKADDLDNRQTVTSLIDDLQELGLVG